LEHRASVKGFVSLQFLNLRHSVGLLGRVISQSQGRYLTQTKNKHRYPCLEWDSNTRFQCSSGTPKTNSTEQCPSNSFIYLLLKDTSINCHYIVSTGDSEL
jgi:hypothetical protein